MYRLAWERWRVGFSRLNCEREKGGRVSAEDILRVREGSHWKRERTRLSGERRWIWLG